MHIVLLTQNFAPDVGGIEVLMTGLAGALAGRGHRVLVLADTPRPGSPPLAGPPSPYEVRRFGGPRPWRRRRKARHAARLLREAGIDAVIADSWKSLELLPAPPGIPVLCLAHGMEFPLHARPGKRRRITRSLRGVQVIANSRYTAARAAPFLDGAGAVTVIPPGIDAPPQAEPAERDRARQALAGRQPRLISVARLEPHKGIDRVIECLPALRREFPQIVYVLLGEGPDRERLQRLIEECGVSDRVVLAGTVDEGRRTAWLAESDVFVLPGRRVGDRVEGFGIAFIEAAWRGVPSIAGADGGGGEAVRDGETGLVCDGGDPAAVRAAIHALLYDPARRRELGEAARARAPEFSWDRIVRRYEELLLPS